MNAENLSKILEEHKKWLGDSSCGIRADLRGENLSKADLRGEDLRRAYLNSACLRVADLSGSNLGCAYLSKVDLRGANLSCVDLHGACLREADLREADLSNANLSGADINGADLSGANLDCSCLTGADLRGADLSGTNLDCSNLHHSDLDEHTTIDNKMMNRFFPLCCPEVGAFIGWKKIEEARIVKLLIPEDAQRSSGFRRKCRCSKATVLAIEQLDGTPEVEGYIGKSLYNPDFTYKVGETIVPDKFDPDRKNECSNGIHFFITRDEAVYY